MSAYSDEESPDKNPRRANRFELISTSKNVDEDDYPQRSKNSSILTGEYLKPKKVDVNPFSRTPLKKNLANNRLKRLRQNLKSDINKKTIAEEIGQKSNTECKFTNKSNSLDKYRVPRLTKTAELPDFSKNTSVLVEDSSNPESRLQRFSNVRDRKRNISSLSDASESKPECSQPKKFAVDSNREFTKLSNSNPCYLENIGFHVSSDSKYNQNKQSKIQKLDKSPIKLKVNHSSNLKMCNPCAPIYQKLSRIKHPYESMKKIVKGKNLCDIFSEPEHLSPLLKGSLNENNISRTDSSFNNPPNLLSNKLLASLDSKNKDKLNTISMELIPQTNLESNSMANIEKYNILKSDSLSQRLSKIKSSFKKNVNTATYKNEIKRNNISLNTNNYENDPNFKPNHTPNPVQLCQDMSRTVRNDNAKLEMTSVWVRNLQCETDQLPQNLPLPCDSDSADEMEWTNAEPDCSIETNNQMENIPGKIENIPGKSKDICIVVDTNVFISALSKVKEILNIRITGNIKPILFIPWMVITELDYMKDYSSKKTLHNNISDSIKFINTALKENHPQVKGQTDVDKQKQLGSSPDDKIISCCLQVAESYESVILLSNDLNLKNRLMINGIPVASSHNVIVKIMSKLAITVKSQKIMQKLSIVCSSIICDCTKEVYGNAWSQMDMLSCPPWSLNECLKRFKKYWRSVFKDKLMKQFTKVLEDLSLFLAKNKFVPDDSEEYIKFMKLCITLCIFLKDIEECRSIVKNTLNEITKLG